MMLKPWLCALGAALLSNLASADEEVKSIPLRTHSLTQPYLDSDMQSRWFDFGGDTIVRADKYIRLSSEQHSRAGWLFSRVPLTASNWEIEVEFKIHGTQTLYGDGMAMWLTEERAQQGQVFGSKDKFKGLGIFVDTYKNNRPGTVFPYVMAMLGDGETSYDKENDGKANELAGCSARGIRNAAVPTKLKLSFAADKSNTLTLDLQYNSAEKWENCFSLPNIKLPLTPYLGFSAETGELSDNHDVIAINTKNLYTPPGPDGHAGMGSMYEGKPRMQRSDSGGKSGGGWFWFFIKFIIFGVVVTGGYVGFTAWRTQQGKSRF